MRSRAWKRRNSQTVDVPGSSGSCCAYLRSHQPGNAGHAQAGQGKDATGIGVSQLIRQSGGQNIAGVVQSIASAEHMPKQSVSESVPVSALLKPHNAAQN